MFKDIIYKSRRDQLRRDVGTGIIFLPGNDESPMNYADNAYHFRQDSTFLYFFGMNRPGLYATLDIQNGIDTVYGDDFTVEDFVWMGKQPTIAEESFHAGITETGNLKKLYEELDKAVSAGRKIHFLPPYRSETIVKLNTLLGLPLNIMSASASVHLIEAVVRQRSIKSNEEIIEIEKAVNISVDMHESAMKMVRPGMKEL